MDFQDFVALSIVALAVFWVVRKFRTGLSGCDSCGTQSSKGTRSSPRPTRLPLIPPDQIGLPLSTADQTRTDTGHASSTAETTHAHATAPPEA